MSRVAKVKSDRDLVDSGIKALVAALGYSGAARFLRHFSKGEGDYLVIQRDGLGTDLQEGKRTSSRQVSYEDPSRLFFAPHNDCRLYHVSEFRKRGSSPTKHEHGPRTRRG